MHKPFGDALSKPNPCAREYNQPRANVAARDWLGPGRDVMTSARAARGEKASRRCPNWSTTRSRITALQPGLWPWTQPSQTRCSSGPRFGAGPADAEHG